MSATGIEGQEPGAFGSRMLTRRAVVDRVAIEQQRESTARSAFAVWPVGMGFGIAMLFNGHLAMPGFLAWSIVAITTTLYGLRYRSGWPSLVLIVVAAVALGQGLARLELDRTRTTILSGDVTTRVTGRVLSRETDGRGRQRYVLEVLETDRPHLSRPPERVRVWVSARHEPIEIGRTLEALVRWRPPPGPAYPGAYDFVFAPYFDGLGAYGFALGRPIAGSMGEPTLRDRVTMLRLAMGERIRAVLPGATGAVASALITGERAGIPEEIEEDLRTTSLAHILSISGFHMALVAGFVMLALRTLLAAIPAVALRMSTRKIAAIGALGATTFYFALSGDNAATQRSFIMIALMLGAVLLDKPALTLRNVAIAAIVVMTVTPHAVLTATFQMSFAATAALVGAFGAYTRWQSDRRQPEGTNRRTLRRTIWVVLAATALSAFIAGAATAPYGVYHFHRAAPFGLLANLIATPLFTFWIMPAALISAISMPFGLDFLPLRVTGLGLDLTFALAHQLALWMPDQATGRITAASLVAFTAAILLLSFAAGRLRWVCVPLTILGLALAKPSPAPDLLVFEDGRELAIRTSDGGWAYLQDKPNRFVIDQWERAYNSSPSSQPDAVFRCIDAVCRARTPSGIRVAWTDSWEQLDEACREADVAVVARAIRQRRCTNGTTLATLRTLRRSGSLGITHADGEIVIMRSVDPHAQDWNRHRLAAWPERWLRPPPPADAPSAVDAAANGSGESDQPVDPGP